MTDAALPWLAPLLHKALSTAQGHAMLLHGPRGVGQFDLALALAGAWLCESPGPDRPCGACPACRLLAARSHPDLLVVLPDALREALSWIAPDDEPGAGSKSKPSKEIRVEAIRALVAFAQTTSARGGGKVVVVHPAERMNAVAANTLLKTLEEPPGDTRFILSSAAPEALLPTVRSRCQAFALPLPAVADAVAWLAGQGVAQPEVLLAASGGQPADAVDAAADGLNAALWLRLPELVCRGDAGPLAGVPLPRVIDALQKLCHDLLRRCVAAVPRYFPADVLPPAADLQSLLAWAATLQAAARHAEHPWHATLAAESLILQGRRAIAPRDEPRATGVSLHSNA